MARPRTPKGRAREVARRLALEYPDASCALRYETPFQLLVATILSAQCTDERVNLVTPELFARFPDAESTSAASQEELEKIIHSTGFFRNKAKSILGMAVAVAKDHGGEIPNDMKTLVKLPGVGRKTANVLMSVAGGDTPLEGIAVDTHVARLSMRLGLCDSKDPVVIERELMSYLPLDQWGSISLRLIMHGRAVCGARKPACSRCTLADICPSAGKVVGST